MKNRRDFLKTLLGVVLVAPVACRTIVPEPVVLPAAVEPETMFAQNPKQGSTAHFMMQEREAEAIIVAYRRAHPTIAQARNSAFHTPQFVNGSYQVGTATPGSWLDYDRGPTEWASNHIAVFPNRPVRPWLSARYWK